MTAWSAPRAPALAAPAYWRGAARLGAACGLVTLAAVAVGCGDSSTSPTTPESGVSWSQATPLRDAAASSGRMIGAAVVSSLLRSEAAYAGTAARHFDYLTAEWEMKWDPIQRVPGEYDFSGADAIVGFAESHAMRVKGHTLVWHAATPAWVASLSPPELRIAFEDHIRIVVGHYRGRVWAWDVVNEAIDDATLGWRDTVFLRGLGPDYVADAFRLAREADPEAELVYNDYGGEGLSRKSEAIYEMVRDLRAKGVPIDGVGLQMHVSATSAPSAADVASNIRRLAALGLNVNISEMDVQIRQLGGDAASRLARQRQVYHDIVAACVAEPRCEAVTTWGVSDAHSWIDSFFGSDDPLLFDELYLTKPAFAGVEDAFSRR